MLSPHICIPKVPLQERAKKNKNFKVKQLWAPPSGRDAMQPSGEYNLKWPQLDSSRKPQKLIQSKRVVKKSHAPETRKYMPNGCDQWFAHVGIPPPSVRTSASARSRMSTCRRNAENCGNNQSSRSNMSGASARNSARQSTARSQNSLYNWEVSSSELWDRKLQLERELKAVEEQQSELLGNHVARMNKLMFNRPKV